MNAIFADTAFFVAIFSHQDHLHDRAKTIATKLTATVVSSEFVLVEVGNFFSRGKGRARFQRVVEHLRAAEDFEVIPASSEFYRLGVELFASRSDKNWSLTDYISFVMMQKRGIIDALTEDHHFVQAGFNALLV